MQSDRDVMLRSGAANTAFAAENGDQAEDSVVQAVSEPIVEISNPETGADAYEVAELRKADLFEYDDSLMLVRYEAVDSEPDETPTTTTAVTTEIPKNFENQVTTETTSVVTTVEEPAVTEPQPVEAAPDSVVFHSYGYGHGVGMSQNGANFYAKYDGWTYDQILSLYYPGTMLVQTGVSEYETMTVGGKTDTVVSILSQIVNNEMGDSFSEEALKAQAIAAYTYYLYNGYGAGMICKANPSQKITDAVRSVLGIVVYYENEPALTSFYASSGGATASCRDIFYADLPYLSSVTVRHDESSDPHYNTSKVFSSSELKSKLESIYHVTLSGNPYEWIQLEYGDGGYVAFAVIGGQVRVKGNDLRSVLGLKSPKFEFEYQSGASGIASDAPAADPGAANGMNGGEADSVVTSTNPIESEPAGTGEIL
jgi:peptidoglycan hydrolase-like amidase